MQIAQVLAGYSLGEADLLRRAMGKKIKEEMDKQRARFVEGAVERGLQAAGRHDLRSARQVRRLRLQQVPRRRLRAGRLSDRLSEGEPSGRVPRRLDDARHVQHRQARPSVQTSFRHFETGENRIYYALAAIKGVGDAAVEHIVEVRGDTPFASLEDFCTRIDPRQVNRRVLESLIAAGAFDCFGHDRAILSGGLDRILGFAQRAQENRISGQSDMFGIGGGAAEAETIQLPAATPWLPAEKLHREYQALGFYLSAHPLDSYNDLLAKMRVQTWADFSLAVKAGATAGRLAGTVTSKQERKTRTGNKMGIVAFSDSSGQYEAVLFSEGLALYRELLEPGKSIVITVNAEERPEGIGLRIQTADSLEDRAARGQSALRVYMRDARPLNSVSTHLKSRGEGQVSFVMIKDDGRREIEVTLPDRYKISPQLASALKAAPGVLDVELV
jgi:DNA polymerase-3 subunit alpha